MRRRGSNDLNSMRLEDDRYSAQGSSCTDGTSIQQSSSGCCCRSPVCSGSYLLRIIWRIAVFWPTQTAISREEFTGPQACASCHANKFASAQLTPMGSGAMLAADSQVLKSNPHLGFSVEAVSDTVSTPDKMRAGLP